MNRIRLIIFSVLFLGNLSLNAEIALVLYDYDDSLKGADPFIVPIAKIIQRAIDKYGEKYCIDSILKPSMEGRYLEIMIGMDSQIYYCLTEFGPTTTHSPERPGQVRPDMKCQLEKINALIHDMSVNNDTIYCVSNDYGIFTSFNQLGVKELPYTPSEEEYYIYFRDFHSFGSGQLYYNSEGRPVNLPEERCGALIIRNLDITSLLIKINQAYNNIRKSRGLEPIRIKGEERTTDPQILQEIYDVALQVIRELASIQLKPKVILPITYVPSNKAEAKDPQKD